MQIVHWSLGALATYFSIQYDHTVLKEPIDARYVNISGADLVMCVNEGDLPFKKGSNTYPRTEFRLRNEVGSPGQTYTYEVNFEEPDEGVENLSIWQIFGRNPEVMVRVREGEKQLVVFGGEPKIQRVDELPRKCSVTCGDRKGRGARVVCGEYDVPAKIRCKDKLHLKFGPYLQHVEALSRTCVNYHNVTFP